MSKKPKTNPSRLQNQHISPPTPQLYTPNAYPHTESVTEYSLLSRITIWMRRFRHRCGYGIHSPYAFHLVTDVVYNPLPYYAYEPLTRQLPYNPLRLDRYEPASGLIAKDLRLIFRLVNHQAPTHIAQLGASPATIAHIRAARTTAAITTLTNAPSAATASLVYLDAPHHIVTLRAIGLDTLPTSTMIIVRGIHRDDTARQQWLTLRDDTAITLTIDLWRFGIALRRPKTTPEHYVVSYF